MRSWWSSTQRAGNGSRITWSRGFVAELIVSKPWEDKVDAWWFLYGALTLVLYLTLWPLVMAVAIRKAGRL